MKAVVFNEHGGVGKLKYTDFADKVKEFTDGMGVDLLFEHIGPETWEKSLLCLKRGGRLVTCGATSGPTVNFDLLFLFRAVIWKVEGNY